MNSQSDFDKYIDFKLSDMIRDIYIYIIYDFE